MKKNRLEGLIVLLLTGVFAVCILLVLITGARTYKNLTERGRKSYANRSCAQYIVSKIRQSDRIDGIYTDTFRDSDALVLRAEINGKEYLTRIYEYDGYLMELFCEGTAELSPWDGEKIMKTGDLSFLDNDGLININYTDESGNPVSTSVAKRSGGTQK